VLSNFSVFIQASLCGTGDRGECVIAKPLSTLQARRKDEFIIVGLAFHFTDDQLRT